MSVLPQNINLENNIISSVEAYLYQNIVLPYNEAVTSTNFTANIRTIMDDPDDPASLEKVPVITLPLTSDYKAPESTGLADNLVWVYKEMILKCYPALSQEGSVTKPSITATGYLRSLFTQLTTGLIIPLYDFTQSGNPQMDGAYITSGRIIQIRGRMSTLASEKHRFDFELRFKLPLVTLDG